MKNIEKQNNEDIIVETLGIPYDLFERLKPMMKLQKIKKSQMLIDENHGENLFYIVKSGIARSYVIDNKGKEFIRTLYTAGMPMALVKTVVTGQESSLKFDCLTNCEFYVGNYKELRELAQKDLEISNNYARLMELVYLNMEERVFELTLSADKKYKLLKERIPLLSKSND